MTVLVAGRHSVPEEKDWLCIGIRNIELVSVKTVNSSYQEDAISCVSGY